MLLTSVFRNVIPPSMCGEVPTHGLIFLFVRSLRPCIIGILSSIRLALGPRFADWPRSVLEAHRANSFNTVSESS
jgi:hypothetical protein